MENDSLVPESRLFPNNPAKGREKMKAVLKPAFVRNVLLSLSVLALSGSATISHSQTTSKPTLETKLDASLRLKMTDKSKKGWTSAIVKIDGELTPQRKATLKSLGADIYRDLSVIKSVGLKIPTRNLKRLAELSFVSHLSDDLSVKKCDEFTVGNTGAGSAYASYALTGSGVGVAVLDSGVYYCQDIFDSQTGSYRLSADVSFVPNKSFPGDECGHGTHVAGIIAGSGVGSTGSQYTHSFFGIARKASIANIRVLDSKGQGSVSTVIAGIQWAITNRVRCNIRVMNLSMGHPVGESYQTDPLCQAVESAWKSGIVVVVAAGNNGRLNSTTAAGAANEGYGAAYGSIQSPGNDPYVITVGAVKNIDSTRTHDRIATYSSRGPSRLDLILKPDILAPGNKVISLEAGACPLATLYGSNEVPLSSYSSLTYTSDSQKYFRLSGTSMAAPVVAGAAALLLEKYPTLTPDMIKARLMISADKWADASGVADPCTYGAGYLNIMAALQCTASPSLPAMSPRLVKDAANGVVKMDNVLWGNNVIWGMNGVTNPLNVIWGNNVMWGSNVLLGTNVLWGQSVWTDNVIWGMSASAVDLTSVAIKGE